MGKAIPGAVPAGNPDGWGRGVVGVGGQGVFLGADLGSLRHEGGPGGKTTGLLTL